MATFLSLLLRWNLAGKSMYCFVQGTGYHGTAHFSLKGERYYHPLRGEYMRGNQEWGPGRYDEKLNDLQTRRSLQSQIDSIKAMIASNTNQTAIAA